MFAFHEKLTEFSLLYQFFKLPNQNRSVLNAVSEGQVFGVVLNQVFTTTALFYRNPLLTLLTQQTHFVVSTFTAYRYLL